MSLFNLAKKLTGLFPGTPLSLAQSTITDAIGEIYDTTTWSFQKQQGAFLCPGNVLDGAGSFSVTPYSNLIIADATASAALLAYSGPPLLTQLQYRDPSYAIYNIVAADFTAPAAVVLTLDRPWMEPTSGPGQPYMIYQCYFAAPVADFRDFVEMRDPTNDAEIDHWSLTQAELAVRDPQRSDFSEPAYCVPRGLDLVPTSATYGYQMFELWPHQLSAVPYDFTYRRRGPLPVTAADWQLMLLPPPITEDMAEWKSRELLCQYKEGQKDRATPKGSGANWLMLSQMAQKQFATRLSQAISIDINLDGEHLTYTSRRRYQRGSFATMNSRLNLGSYPES